MANISRVTDDLYTGGDLPPDDGEAGEHVLEWLEAGITHVLDNRIEWSDETLVQAAAPEITYLHNPTDDAGQRMQDEWFDTGVRFALEAMAARDTRVLVHCHMGINRGPSMALAVLLAQGWDVVAALDAIRSARPIAAIGYAEDALDWWQRRTGVPESERVTDRQRLSKWRRDNEIDVATIIRKLRAAGM